MGGRTGSAIEVLALQALAFAGHDQHRALRSLDRAVHLAEAEGYVQVLTGEGSALCTLLTVLTQRRPGWAYARGLHARCAARGARASAPTSAPTNPPTPARPAGAGGTPALVDPLSSRELDVLRLLGSDLDGPAIARRLGVSLSTVRTHTQHIYAKLGVSNRRAAVRRSHQLQLLLSRPVGR
jgi:LuxR family maltose regulon positive regulatory protein